MMDCKKKSIASVILAALMALTLAACASGGTKDGVQISGESLDINGVALRPDGEASQIYESGGMKLLIPLEYNELLIVDTEQDDMLFSVSEKASVEAAKALGDNDDGAGWIFGIGKVSEEKFHEMLCSDMSGEYVFAKDADGAYYMCYHPTDVRLVRENNADMEKDAQQWIALNEWAATVPDNFIEENAGLVPEKRGNSIIDIYLARIAYMDNIYYTLSTADGEAVNGSGFDASSYLEPLTKVIFEYADDAKTPDGEYIVLNFPDDDTRFDFFVTDDEGCYIRQVWGDDNEMLYRAVFEDGETAFETGNIVRQWYNALAAANTGEALDASDFTGEEFVGEWQDEVSQRATMSVKKTDQTGVYDILIHWGSGYNSAMQWRMTATAGAQDEILSYTDGVKAELTFPDDGDGEEQENIIWDDGTGYFMFRDGYLTWYDEKETEAAERRFVKGE